MLLLPSCPCAACTPRRWIGLRKCSGFLTEIRMRCLRSYHSSRWSIVFGQSLSPETLYPQAYESLCCLASTRLVQAHTIPHDQILVSAERKNVVLPASGDVRRLVHRCLLSVTAH